MKARASRPNSWNVVGMAPFDRPTPLASKRMTSCVWAMSSTRAGSQLSRLPRKCWKNTTGMVPGFP